MLLPDERYLALHKGCVMRKYQIMTAWFIASCLSLLLAITWFTGYQSDRLLTQWLNQLGQTQGVVTSWFDQEKNLFSRQAELHIMIAEPAALLAMTPALNSDHQLRRWLQQSGPIELYIELQQHIFPGFTRGSAHINMQRGIFAEWPDHPAIPHQFYWQVNGINGAVVAGLKMSEWNWLRDELTWLVAPFQAEIKLADQQQVDLSVVWDGMQWRNDQTEERGDLKKLSFNAQLTKDGNLWMLPAADLQLSQLDLRQPDRQLALTQWHWHSGVKENRDGLLSVVDVNSHSNIEHLVYRSQQYDYELSHVTAGLALGGVNRQGFEALLVNSGLDATNVAKWKTGLNLITRAGVQFKLDPFDLTLNREPLRIHGQLTTRPFDVSQVHGVESMRSLLQGDLSLEVTQALTQQFAPVADALPDLLSDGYVEPSEGGHVSTKLRMVNGKLSANGVAVPY